MLFQHLLQILPSYFHHGDLGGEAMGGELGGGGYMYAGRIPSSTFRRLLGDCHLDIEWLVNATLHLPSMQHISMGKVQKARDIAVEFGHNSNVNCLSLVLILYICDINLVAMMRRAGRRRTNRPEKKSILEKLDKGADPEDMHSCCFKCASQLSV